MKWILAAILSAGTASAGPRTVQDAVRAIVLDSGHKQTLDSLSARGFDSLTLICIKDKRELELWLNGRRAKTYKLTAFSGRLGPKRRQGDGQIPEGIYHAVHLNPNSAFHLSIKIDYPNAWDRKWGREEGRGDLGGDIFIHGNQVSIGCLAIGDWNIEELFYLVSKVGVKNTKVIITPYDFRKRDYKIEADAKVLELYGIIRKELEKFRITES